MNNDTRLFKILSKINPVIALVGTFCLANSLQIGWYILIGYNLCNIYVYLKRKRDFWTYATVSFLHMSFGVWAIIR